LAEDQESFGVQQATPDQDAQMREKKFSTNMQVFISHTSNDSARRKPITRLESAYADLLEVDCDAIPFMDQDEKEEILNNLSKIDTRLFEIKKALKHS
jgi:hypothetical protein